VSLKISSYKTAVQVQCTPDLRFQIADVDFVLPLFFFIFGIGKLVTSRKIWTV
jgi:hypothetical protein